MTTTPVEINLLRHALGVQLRGKRWSAPYRNYFAAIPGGSDDQLWSSLCRRGLAVCRGRYVPGSDLVYYQVLPAGRELALDGLPKSVRRRDI